MIFSTFRAEDSNSSAVASAFLTTRMTGLPAGTRTSAGANLWSLMVMVKTCASSAFAGKPGIRRTAATAAVAGMLSLDRLVGRMGPLSLRLVTSLGRWLGGRRLWGDQLGDQCLVLGGQGGVVE